MWDDELPEILRALVDDVDTPQRFSDDKILRVLCVAAFQVLRELTFTQNFRVSVSEQIITPDPTEDPTVDDSFVNLVTQKGACIIDHGSAIIAAGRALAVRDEGSSVDLRGVFQAKLALLEKGWCEVYRDTKFEYKTQLVGVAGAIVMTPFRLYAYGGYASGDDQNYLSRGE